MNEKIIDTIQILSSYGVPQDEEQFREALALAIKALEQSEKTEEMIYMLLNEMDVEANRLKDSKMWYDIGYHDGIELMSHKLNAIMRIIKGDTK